MVDRRRALRLPALDQSPRLFAGPVVRDEDFVGAPCLSTDAAQHLGQGHRLIIGAEDQGDLHVFENPSHLAADCRESKVMNDGTDNLHPMEKQLVWQFFGCQREGFFVEAEGNPVVDFISIDVEGHELDVLRGLTLHRHRPNLLLIEDPVRNLDKHRYLRAHGYRLVKRTALNNWYIPEAAPFTMATLGERLELFRKMYLATPFRQWRLARRRRLEVRSLQSPKSSESKVFRV